MDINVREARERFLKSGGVPDLKKFNPSLHPGEYPGVEMSTKLPDGSMITETYPYKKMPRNP